MYMFVQVETQIVSLMLSENEQESHVISFSSYINFARNSVREVFFASGVCFLDSSLKITLKGSFSEKNSNFFHVIGPQN